MSRSPKALSGGCQCGAVRYQSEGPFDDPEICHCRTCQKAHGAPVVAWAGVPAATLHWTRGTIAEFESSAHVTRGFCRDCGTPLIFRRHNSGSVDIALATLDHPEAVVPESQGGVESRMPWFMTAHELPEHRYGEVSDSHQHPDHDTDQWP